MYICQINDNAMKISWELIIGSGTLGLVCMTNVRI